MTRPISDIMPRRLMDYSRFVVLPEQEERRPGARGRALEPAATVRVGRTDGRAAQVTMAHHRGMPQTSATKAGRLRKFAMSAGDHVQAAPVLALRRRPRATLREPLEPICKGTPR